MTAFRVLLLRLGGLFGGRRREQSLSDEIEAHLEELTAEHMRRGLSRDDARYAARRAFGAVDRAKEAYRDQRGLPFFDALSQDVRFAVRLLVKDRAVTLVAVAALGLGIGVNTTFFTMVKAFCLQGLPIEQPDRVVYIATRDTHLRPGGMSYADFEDLRASVTSLAGMAAFTAAPVAVREEGRPADRFQALYVSAPALRILGEVPILGRDFRAEDDRPGAPPVAILSSAVWKSRYGSDPATIGRSIAINGSPSIVIGVMRDGFAFPNNTELWLPLASMPGLTSQKRDARTLGAFGRLTDTATLDGARTEITTMSGRLSTDHAATNTGITATVVPINERYLTPITHPAWIAFITAGALVVLIACANVANLLLSRSTIRSREIAIRASLGATRRRIVRQLLVESALLASLGGVVGVGLSFIGLRLLTSAIPASVLSYWLDFSIDGRVLGMLAAVCLGTVFVFGLVPALHISRTDVNEVLREGGRAGTGGMRARRWTSVFLTAEFALTTVLLSAVALSVEAYQSARKADAVIDASNLLTMQLALPAQKYATPDQRTAFYESVGERVRAVGGVSSFTIASNLPLGGGATRDVEIDGRPAAAGSDPQDVRLVVVGGDYFQALRLPLRGRPLTDGDGAPGREASVVNERFAAMYFPGADPIGRRIRLKSGPAANTPWMSIVGVSSTVRQDPRGTDPVVYVPYRSAPPAGAALIVRSTAHVEATTPLIREAIHGLDPNVPLFRILTMEQAMAESTWNPRVANAIITIIGAIALALSAVGLFAVTAYAVAQRRQEIGVRMALGAQSKQVGWLVLRRAIRQLAVGLAAGVACTYAWEKFFSSEGEMTDPVRLGAVALLLIVVALAASFAPAWRASRLDPVAALRCQ